MTKILEGVILVSGKQWSGFFIIFCHFRKQSANRYYAINWVKGKGNKHQFWLGWYRANGAFPWPQFVPLQLDSCPNKAMSRCWFSIIHTDIMSEHDTDMFSQSLANWSASVWADVLCSSIIVNLYLCAKLSFTTTKRWQNDLTRCLMFLQNRRKGRLISCFMIKSTYLRGRLCSQTHWHTNTVFRMAGYKSLHYTLTFVQYL